MLESQQFKYVRKKVREPFHTKYALNQEERVELVTTVGVNGLVLFEYFLRMASIEDIEIDDEAAAAYFGWNAHTAARWRRELTKHGWLHRERATTNEGNKVTIYYLGKNEVLNRRRPA